MMRSLEERFQNAQAEYPVLKAACEAQVERWRWASWDRIEDTPHEFKRNGFAKGSWLKQPPKRQGGGVYQYGFDHNDRVIVIRQPLNWPDKIYHYEEFFQYDGDRIDGTLYHYWDDKEPINVTCKTLDGARLVQFERLAKRGLQREIYHYEAGKLAQIQSWDVQDGSAALRTTEVFSYDPLGRLDRIEKAWANGGRQRLYRRLQKGETMRALASKIQRRFVEIILQVITEAHVQEQVYSLALVYDLGNDPLPMLLALGTVAERDEWSEKYGRGSHETRSWVWEAGGNFSLYNIPQLSFEPYLDADLIDTYALFNQQYHLMGISEEPAVQLINAIAAELMQMDWHDKLNSTDDFVVYGVDFEANHLDRNMAVSIPEAQLALLRQRGFL